MLEDLAVVSLKRKVRSLETNLLEWRRCACTFATSDSSCQLVLELSDEDVDDVVLDDAECGGEEDNGNGESRDYQDGRDEESRRGKCRVAIDLGSMLKRIEQKRKTKTRCEVEYYSSAARSSNSRSDKRVRTEELMASSAKHCQQFIDQVREAERQAKRKQSIRLGAVLAANAAALASESGSGASSSHSSRSISSEGPSRRGSQISPPKIQTDRFRMPTATSFKSSSSATSDVAGAGGAGGGILGTSAYSSSGKSEEISPACITPAAASSAASVPDASMPNAEAGAPATNGHSLLLGASLSSPASGRQRHEGAGLSGDQPKYWSPSHRAARERDCESDTLDSSSGSISPRASANPPVASRDPASPNPIANNSLASSQVSSSSSTASKVLFLSSKPLPQEIFAKRLASLRMGTGTGDRESRQSNQQQLQHQESDDDDDDREDSNNRAELHILMRVEAALRQLEKENALAKEREALLSQEVQSLRDALRVKSAEKKHIETQFHQLAREKDGWRQVAREEVQLLQSEEVRLKHQNKELMTRVRRLDSLVCGRF